MYFYFHLFSFFFYCDYSVEYRKKNVQVTDKSPSIDIKNGHRPDMSSEVLLHKFEFDEFGSTPPRTRIKNKNRDWDRRQKL